MRRLPMKWVGVVLALGLLALTLSPAQADSILVPVDSPGNLIIPDSALPAGYAPDPVQSHAATFASLLPTLGKHAYALFQDDGWVTGYHGWLNSGDMTYKAFLTYDFYGLRPQPERKLPQTSCLGWPSACRPQHRKTDCRQTRRSSSIPPGTMVRISSRSSQSRSCFVSRMCLQTSRDISRAGTAGRSTTPLTDR